MKTNAVKVGIVGLGRWAKVLTRAVAGSHEMQIVAGYSRSEEKRLAFEQELGVRAVPDMKTIQSLALLVGIDKFMSECRALTNVIGNGVATIVVSRWEKELDSAKLREAMAHPIENDETKLP